METKKHKTVVMFLETTRSIIQIKYQVHGLRYQTKSNEFIETEN